MANRKGFKSGATQQKTARQDVLKNNCAQNEAETKDLTPIKNSIKRDSFEQDLYTVTVTLFAGKKLKGNDLDVVFTAKNCTVTLLSDGRKWFANFFREIDHEASKVQISRMKIILKIKKKTPGHWMDLEYIAGQSEARDAPEFPVDATKKVDEVSVNADEKTTTQSSNAATSAKSKSDISNKEVNGFQTASKRSDSDRPDFILVEKSHKNQKQTEKVTDKLNEKVTGSVKIDLNKDITNDSAKPIDDHVTNKNAPPTMNEQEEEIIEKIETQGVRRAAAAAGRDSTGDQFDIETATEEKYDLSDLLQDESEKENEQTVDKTLDDQEGVYTLSHVKNDFIEKTVANPNDTITVTIFVKNIIQETVELSVNGRVVGLKFQTKDGNFIKMHEGTNSETFFLWKITVVDDLIESQCGVKVKPIKAEITLRKKEARRWCALEAVNSKEYAKTSSTWKPVVKTTATVAPTPSSQTSAKPSASSSQSSIRQNLSSQSKVGFSDSSNTYGTGAKKAAVEQAETSFITAPSRSTEGGSKGYVLGEGSKDNAQKPTCMVSPLPPQDKMVVPPGFTGLDNMGNTCFMNSVLQVLANTTELRDYFLDGRFQREINYDNVLGSGGKLAVEFGTLLKVLWSGKRSSYAPSTLKKLVAQKKSMFSGFAQHDAQEYMSFLLDGLHEDLNRVKKKPYVEQTDSGGRPDEVVAEEAWRNHRRRDDSFLVDLFQGQYKSKLVCPVCDKVSVTFDPFMHVAVPLPKKQRLLPVVFMWRDPTRRPIKFMLKLAKDATVDNLKDAIHKKTQVHQKNLRVFEVWKSRVHMIFNPGASLASISDSDKIYVQEVLSEKLVGEPVKEVVIIQRLLRPRSVPSKCASCLRDERPDVKLKRCTRCLRTGYCDSTCQREDWHRHKTTCRKYSELIGQPFILSLPYSQLTFAKLYQMADSFSRYSVDVFQPPQPASTSTSSSPASPQHENAPVFSAKTMFGGEDDDSGDSRRNSTVSNEAAASQAAQTETESDDKDQSNTSTKEQENTETVQQNQEKSKQGNSNSRANGTSEIQSDQNAENSENTGTKETPKRLVIGRQQDPEGPAHMFKMRPCGKEGQDIVDSKCLVDKGEELLSLDEVRYLALDWKNDEKSCRPYVMVQAKDLDVIDDASVRDSGLEDRDVTLQQCISLFMQPEVLSSEEAWYCPRCKQHREATKQMSLWRLPSYLIIQLKRFSYRNFLWCDKVEKMVNFPTRGLDLSSYFSGTMPAGHPAPVYDLTGVVNHYGGILGGHYTAYTRTPDTRNHKRSEIGWRLCDDSRVTNWAEERVVTQAAYVLFYRRRDTNLQIPTSIPPNVTSGYQHANAAFDDQPVDELKTSATVSAEKSTVPHHDIADDFTSLSSADSGVSFNAHPGTSSSGSSKSSSVFDTQHSSSSSMFDAQSSTASGDSGYGSAQQKLDFTAPPPSSNGDSEAMEVADNENEATYTDMDSVD